MVDLEIYEKALTVADAWASRRPDKMFFGMTLEDFRTRISPSGEARTELAALDTQMRELLKRRDKADEITRRAVLRVVNGVKGDPEEGEDSELLRVMGYIPHTARSSIISAARRSKSAAKAAVNTAGDEEVES
jgi:hypothetical protein